MRHREGGHIVAFRAVRFPFAAAANGIMDAIWLAAASHAIGSHSTARIM